MTLEIIISFFITSLVLTISPGPDIMYVLSTSITKGRQFGIAAAIGLSSGLLFHTSLLAFGVSALIVASPWLYTAIKVFGTLYLLRIIYLLYSSPVTPITIKDSNNSSLQNSNVFQQVQQGLIMNVLNPKVMLFFLSLFPSFLNEKVGSLQMQIYTLGSIFMIQALLVFVSVAILSSSIRSLILKNEYIQAYMNYVQIAVFIIIIAAMWWK